MMGGSFSSKFYLQTNIYFLASLIVENITCASCVWYVVITWICDELFRMGVWKNNQPVLLK